MFFRIIILFVSYLLLNAMTIYDISFDDSRKDGKIKLSEYRGKVIMVVNTASLCGFTKQYGDLQKIWEEYKDRGFVLIAVPTNDFGGQEPKSDKEIIEFCEVNFGINFPITKKVTSKGDEKHEFFKLIKSDFSKFSGPSWNFYKYIYSPSGEPIEWYSSMTNPTSSKIRNIIEKNLPSKSDGK
jgi:glutathione peroxidase